MDYPVRSALASTLRARLAQSSQRNPGKFAVQPLATGAVTVVAHPLDAHIVRLEALGEGGVTGDQMNRDFVAPGLAESGLKPTASSHSSMRAEATGYGSAVAGSTGLTRSGCGSNGYTSC